uniref:Uncharacterized protein n=1 Tax=Panagrolaimus davidi TaxID=227884 RepID=A0A914PIQ9_9BILA
MFIIINANNGSGGRQSGEDDARVCFDALELAIRNLLIEEARGLSQSSTSRGNYQRPSYAYGNADMEPAG